MTAELTHLEELLAEQDEPQLSLDEYKAVFRGHPAGVAVIALEHDGRLVGFTATSVISVSAAPPLLAFSLASTSSSWPAVSAARTLTVSFLADHQDDVSARFATSGVDRFADGGWSRLPTGEPVIDGALSWVRGRVVQRTPVGDSYLVSLRALASSVGDDARHEATATRSPLVYHDRTYHRIGDHSAL
ncbi:flavin reductase [Cellulosimicrobium sp. BIT-GX5]|uniref:Flavin reductase n=1 Tax=Cellulosimicrobium composti TaxID=2672572 RepID=A0A6N7ZE38_9MICO|nr:flavin reductase family protein [Cellulosimicrobium composti]MTG87562.1 flavin reductase [Cellulosimicrobium composti]NDO88452.1 flavin reductase family protein [Cellulosimicrobium composti]TWG86102.1 flavin reductase (DIM6/NTAB) family NADH-FMN oxidoreductase RutF [Cellulosimicrobium cellulans J34]SME90254.1 NADH-FMN oxidoreductase RutF, flavin reductase (DIM6/NTAB) family [Cellulosimicrobium cellulans J1]